MTKRLDVRQTNNVITGTRLAAEIPASTQSRRAFLVVGAYGGDPKRPRRVSRYLNADHGDDHYWLRVVEIDKGHMSRPDSDDFEHELVALKGIASIVELETELGRYLDDFSSLDVPWRLDYVV